MPARRWMHTDTAQPRKENRMKAIPPRFQMAQMTQPDLELGTAVRDTLLELIGAAWNDREFDPDRMNQLIIAVATFIVNIAARSSAPDLLVRQVACLLREGLTDAIRFQAGKGDEA